MDDWLHPVYVFIKPCGCVTGAATAQAMDEIVNTIHSGRRVELRKGPVDIPTLCLVHAALAAKQAKETEC